MIGLRVAQDEMDVNMPGSMSRESLPNLQGTISTIHVQQAGANLLRRAVMLTHNGHAEQEYRNDASPMQGSAEIICDSVDKITP